MQIMPDFSEALEGDREPIPVGKYPARIMGVEAKESQNGNPYLNWKYEIFGCEGELTGLNGRTVFGMTMISGPGSFRLKQLLEATDTDQDQPFDTDDLIGAEVELTLSQRSVARQDGTTAVYPDVKSISKWQG